MVVIVMMIDLPGFVLGKRVGREHGIETFLCPDPFALGVFRGPFGGTASRDAREVVCIDPSEGPGCEGIDRDVFVGVH